MLGKIIEILENSVIVELSIDINQQPNLVNLHVVFENGNEKIIGEIVNINQSKMFVSIVGELKEHNFTPGVSSKPSFKSLVRMVRMDELETFLGRQQTVDGYTFFGFSNVYKNYKINVSVNDFFSNHFAILGNSGAGKSFTVSSIMQKLFLSRTDAPIGANIFIFDAYGEYTNAFKDLNKANSLIHYKTYTTNTHFSDTEVIKIPVWLLDVDDLALLLDVTTPNQLPIIEKTLKLVPILTGNSPDVIKHKNDIIARALEDILLSGHEATKIRDQVVAVLTKFNTEELNLEATIAQPGYVRTFKQCLLIDKMGKMQEMELIVDFVKGFIDDNLALGTAPEQAVYYTLNDLEQAMEFALISEGILKSDKVFDYANVLSVRLHSLANGEERAYFDYPEYISRTAYIQKLLTDPFSNSKCQIVNFNINYVDDRLAKVMTKILSKLLFNMAVENPTRGSMPFHIVIEEAHRYVQKDTDTEILGYNIFDRITKEGRKYGIILGLITQRPSELSDTAISQCSNFIILRTLHPKDLDYIKNMVPNVSQEVIVQLKSLKPGNCVAFGSAFKVPVFMYVEKPNPTPLSNNVDVNQLWYHYTQQQVTPSVLQEKIVPIERVENMESPI